MVDLKKVARQLEEAYQAEKNKEAEELHNALAEVIAEKKATIQNTLYVLQILQFELLRAKYEQIMGRVEVPPGGGLKPDAKLTTSEAK